MDAYSLFELARIRAIHAAIDPSLDSIWRIKLRNYSEKFHTPLHEVVKLDPMFVLQHLYEDKLPPSVAEEELEDLLEELYKIKDPSYMKMSPEDLEDFVDQVLNKEIKRLGLKKNPTKEIDDKPKNGSMNFNDLEKSTSES